MNETTTPAGRAEPKHRAQELASEAKSAFEKEAKHVADSAKDLGSEALEVAQAKAAEGVDAAKSSAVKIAEGQKVNLATKVDGYRRAAEAAAAKLKDEDDTALSEHIGQLASKLDEATDYLRAKSIPSLAKDFGRITRRHPELVLGGTALLGFALTRFLKASSEEPPDSRQPGSYSYQGGSTHA